MVVTGRLALLALVGVPIVGALPSWSTVALLILALVAIATIDALLAAPVGALTIERSGPHEVRLGDSVDLELTIRSTARRRARGLLRDAWMPSAGAWPARHRLEVAPGGSATAIVRLTPTRRGDRRTDRITVRLLGPLGIGGRQGRHDAPWTVRALPPFGARKHLPSRLSRLQELEGRTPVMVRGQGTEFDTLRTYVEGDDVRSIDWRATARSNDLMVRTWRPERDRRVVIVLDTGRTAAARIADAPRLDSALDAALLLAALAGRAGDHVTLLAHDVAPRAFVSGAEGADLLPSMVGALATVDAALVESDYRALASRILAQHRQRSLVVLLTALEPVALTTGLVPVLPSLLSRHHVVIASVTDPALSMLAQDVDDVDGVYAAAAVAAAAGEQGALARRLRQQGVDVVQAEPDRIAPVLADHYVMLKASGRL